VLDPHCLAAVTIPAKTGTATLSAVAGAAKPDLAEQGWRVFLVKVFNNAGANKIELRPTSPNAQPLTRRSSGKADPIVQSVGQVDKRFLDLMSYAGQPLLAELSGLELEYRILQIFCRDAGRKEATLGFTTYNPATKKDLAVSPPVPFLFESS